MKLKTLQNIEFYKILNSDNQIADVIEMLKQEAIKWIKELQKSLDSYPCSSGNKLADSFVESFIGGEYSAGENIDGIKFIRYFFNITEEELGQEGNPHE